MVGITPLTYVIPMNIPCPPASDIWRSSLETCVYLKPYPPTPSLLLISSSGHWNTYSYQVGSMHPIGILSGVDFVQGLLKNSLNAVLKPRADISRSPKQGISVTTQKRLMFCNFFLQKELKNNSSSKPNSIILQMFPAMSSFFCRHKGIFKRQRTRWMEGDQRWRKKNGERRPIFHRWEASGVGERYVKYHGFF